MAQGRAKGSPKTGGRRPGSPNKVTKALKEMILGALDQAGGQQYLADQAELNPAAFMSLLARVLPTTLAGDPNAPLQTISRIELIPLAPRKPGAATD